MRVQKSDSRVAEENEPRWAADQTHNEAFIKLPSGPYQPGQGREYSVAPLPNGPFISPRLHKRAWLERGQIREGKPAGFARKGFERSRQTLETALRRGHELPAGTRETHVGASRGRVLSHERCGCCTCMTALPRMGNCDEAAN